MRFCAGVLHGIVVNYNQVIQHEVLMFDSVLVTGGSRGIGEAVVRCFSAAGKRVAFIYNNSSENALLISRETGATAIQADIRDTNRFEAAIHEAKDALGSIDVLINNAGISQIKLFQDITREDWDNMLNVNLTSVYTAIHAVLPGMIRKNSGRIINVSSVWGIHGASCEVHYSAAKAAVIGLTKALAKELELSDITVNCVAPGVIDTDMNAHFSDDEKSEIVSDIPAGRMGSADEVARVIAFLASDLARNINGQVITIDGGYSL